MPGRTAVDMQTETVRRLSEVSNIVGVKDATGDLNRLTEMQAVLADNFGLYSGDDETGTEFMLRGGHGVISVTSNVAPKQMSEMCTAALAGDRKKAEALNKPLLGLHTNLFVEANPIPVKWAIAEMKMIGLAIRLPMTVLSENYHDIVRDSMKQAGVL